MLGLKLLIIHNKMRVYSFADNERGCDGRTIVIQR